MEEKVIGGYKFKNLLGEGQFGKVFKAVGPDSIEYAVKVLDKDTIDSNPMLDTLLKTEVAIMKEISHPNILHLFELLESKTKYYMILNYCKDGDLEHYIRQKERRVLEEDEAVFFLKQISSGFQELYANKIMHRDFKSANVFLDEGTVVIGDFGLAKSGFEMASTTVGTPLTMAPEIMLEESQYNSKADLWSIGIVFYHMLFGREPFQAASDKRLLRLMRNKSGQNLKFRDRLNSVSNEAKDLLRRLLVFHPKERISWNDFFKHSLFNKKSPETKSRRNSEQTEGAKLLLFQAMREVLTKPEMVDQEFSKLKEKHREYNEVVDPTGLGLKPEIRKINESDPTLDNFPMVKSPKKVHRKRNLGDSELKNFRNISHPYFHFRNILLSMLNSVRGIITFLKQKANLEEELTKNLYFLSYFFSYLAYQRHQKIFSELLDENNSFGLEDFEKYVDTVQFEKIVTFFEEDEMYLLKYKKTMEKIIKRINKNLAGLDSNTEQEIAEKILDKTRRIFELASLANKKDVSGIWKLIVMGLEALSYEKYLPFENNGIEFNWRDYDFKMEKQPDKLHLKRVIKLIDL